MRPDDPRQRPGFRLRLHLARAAEAWERGWPAAWPPLAWLAAFLIISLLDGWARLPGWLHVAGLVFLVGGFARSLWRRRRLFAWSDHEDGLRRMEAKGGMRHRPLRGLDDSLNVGAGDPASLALWHAHRRRLVDGARAARVGAPRSDLPRRDPRALRMAALLGVTAAAVVAGPDAGRRLERALRPNVALAAPGPAMQTAVWVTPPAYTGRPPFALPVPMDRGANTAPVTLVPAGSRLLAQVHHAGAPAGELRLAVGNAGVSFAPTGEVSAEAAFTPAASGRLVVEDGDGERAAWMIAVLPDRAPTARFTDTPGASARAALRTPYAAGDDHGVAGVTLLLSRPGAAAPPERFALREARRPEARVTGTGYLDLTPHPLAGLPVILRLEARDAAGQFGRSPAVAVTLPERDFKDPLARAIIAERRRLVAEPDDRRDVAENLASLAEHGAAERHGPVVPLALRAAADRLVLNDDERSRREVVDMLWDTALHIEDGGTALAEQRLRDAQDNLREALEEGAAPRELERLMAELQRAMNEFLQAMAEQQGTPPQDLARQPPQEQQSQAVTPEDLNRMLERAREMLRSGAREEAERMLTELRRMLENLQAPQPNAQAQQQQRNLNELQRLIQRQQGLLDRTFQMDRRASQQAQPGQAEPQDGQSPQPGQAPQPGQGPQAGGDPNTAESERAAGDQEALRRALGDVMRRLGESGMDIPRALGEAEMAMRRSSEALSRGAPGQAVDPESRALDAMRQGGQAMMEAMAQQQGQGAPGPQGQRPGGTNPGGRDPLGRSPINTGGIDTEGTDVPDQMELGRAREILRELYRRAGERARPAVEREYIERLLERF